MTVEMVSGLSFVVPAYNEENGIADTVARLALTLSKMDMPWEIIVVNDGSSDNTLKAAEQFDRITVINHPVNIGYGNALKTGIRAARYEWVGITDADGTYPIEMIPEFVAEMSRGFDMVIGLRQNLSSIDMPLKKGFRWLFRLIIKMFIGSNIPDPNSGFRIFRRTIVIGLYPFLCGTFSFTTSLTILAAGMSCFIKYIPVQYSRREGSSKVRHFTDSVRTLQYIIQGITFFNPIKFFLLLSFAMILLVCIPAMIFAVFRMHTLSLYYMIFGTTVVILIGMGVLGDIIRISAARREAISRSEQIVFDTE